MSAVPSSFNPESFLAAQTTEVNTKRPPLPTSNPASPDGLYTAVIGQPKTDSGTIDKGDRAGQPWLAFLVPVSIQVPQQVQDMLGVKLEKGTITLTDRVFIDLTPDGKGIDNSVGKNRRQRQYREALDLNKPGDIWSWNLVAGRPIKVQVTHEIFNNEPQERVGTLLKA